MKDYKKIGEEEFQKLPLKERESFVSVVQSFSGGFEAGALYEKNGPKEEIKGCMNCGNIECGNNKRRRVDGCGCWLSPERKIANLEADIEMRKNAFHDYREQVKNDNDTYEQKIADLEAQIEKMKCCDNCLHCGCGSCDEAGNCICDDCNEDTLSEWECIL